MKFDLSSPAGRLRWARDRAGFKNQADLANLVKIRDITYRAYENGQNGFAKHAALFARTLGVTAEWLLEGGRTPQIDTRSSELTSEANDTVEVQEWNFSRGFGSDDFMFLPITGQTHVFTRGWLRNFTLASPDKVFVARGTGDSMTPTIMNSDIVLIDTSDREIHTGDKIWAIAYGSASYIKRIRPMADGSMKMLSDNCDVASETVHDGEMNVIGRVSAIIRKT